MQQQQQGTKHLQYQKVPDTEGTGTTKTTVGMCTIAALPGFRPPNDKSFAELRWEDYQVQVLPVTPALPTRQFDKQEYLSVEAEYAVEL